MVSGPSSVVDAPQFWHEAFFYANDEEYVEGASAFIGRALAVGEPVLVAVPSPRLELIRSMYSESESDLLSLVAMDELGRNPAWIIPAWTEFVHMHRADGRPARGIGEPVWHGRSADEVVECGRHEALLNLAFADIGCFTLLCPYDVGSLEDSVIDEARRNHPHISRAGVTTASEHFRGEVTPWLDTPLSPVPPTAEIFTSDHALTMVRRRAAEMAAAAGVSRNRVDDFVLALSEAVTNSLRHGGGTFNIALWYDDSRLLCEVRDRGLISEPLAGRIRPGVDQSSGRGLWIMNQLCDLVQLRRVPDGQAIRLHMMRSR